MLLDDDAVERRTQFDAIQTRHRRGGQAQRTQFLIGVGYSHLRFAQGLLGLEVVLFSRDLLLPQLLLPLVCGLGQRQSLLSGLQLAALL